MTYHGADMFYDLGEKEKPCLVLWVHQIIKFMGSRRGYSTPQTPQPFKKDRLNIIPRSCLTMFVSKNFLAAIVALVAATTSCCSAFVTPSIGNIKSRASFGLEMAAGDTNYNKVFVAGGSRGVGKHIVEKLVANGHEVVALVRSDEAVEELAGIEGVTPIKGDAFDYKSVENNMDGCDAAITTLGGAAATGDGEARRVDYEGNNNVIEAAGILGVTRVVLVTSIGCGSSKDAVPESAYEVLKDALDAKQRAENVLIKYYTNTNWTIIRPGGLKSEAATGKAIVTEDTSAIGTIHREDVADLVVKTLTSAAAEKKVLSAIDPSIESATNPEGNTFDEFSL